MTCHHLLPIPSLMYISLIFCIQILFSSPIHRYTYWFLEIVKNHNFMVYLDYWSRPSVLAEAKTTLLLINRDHTSTFGCVNSLQHGNYLVHFRSFIRVRIPASFHYVRQRTWATSWHFWSKILKFQKKLMINIMDSS